MTKEKPYREGNDETLDEPVKEVPITAFLIMMLPDGNVDVVTKLPGLNVQRDPTVNDVRNLAQTVSQDAQARILAAQASGGVARSLTSMISAMGGQQLPQGMPGMMVPPGFSGGPRPVPVKTPDLSGGAPKGKK